MQGTQGYVLEDVSDGVTEPQRAKAEAIRDRSASNTIAGAFNLTERLLRSRSEELEKRAAELEKRAAELDAREAKVREAQAAVLEAEPRLAAQVAAERHARLREADEIVQDALQRARKILTDAHAQANQIVVDASSEGGKLLVQAAADAGLMRTESREVLISSGAVGEESRKILPPPVTGAAMAGKLGEQLIATAGTVLERLVSSNPAAAGRALDKVAAAINGGAPTCTLAEVEAAVKYLGEERLEATLKAWGKERVEDLTSEEAAQLVAAVRAEQGGRDGGTK